MNGWNSGIVCCHYFRLCHPPTDEFLGAIQTLLRIFDAYGDKLSSEAWSVCIKSVIFKLLSSIERELNTVSGSGVNEQYRRDWYDTAVVVLNGISGLLANYLDVLTLHPTFNSYWQQLLGHFATLLDFRVLEINTAAFKALAQILSHSQNGAEQNFNRTTLDLAWDLWSRCIPISETAAEKDNVRVADNQGCLLAYVAALREVYRLIQADLTVEHIRRMLTLLHEATQVATPGAFVHDIDYTTPLQGQVLDVLKTLRTDIRGAPAALISQTSKFVSLAFDEFDRATESSGTSKKRTYVAMSKASMEILEVLITDHASDADIYLSGAFLAALSSLSKPIVLKYQFPIVTKSIQPWRQATTSALFILEATLPQLRVLGIPPPTVRDIWQAIVKIANGVTSAECDSEDALPEKVNIRDDEAFDISAFLKLHNLILPSLGAEVVPERTRRAFAENLFRLSIIHAPAPVDHAIMYGSNRNSNGRIKTRTGDEGAELKMTMTDLYKPRRGRTVDPPPARREKMCYVCLDELFSLVAAHDEASTPHITIQPPTPAFPPPGMLPVSTNSSNSDPPLPSTTYQPPPSPAPALTPQSPATRFPLALKDGKAGKEEPHALHVRLARTTAPYLILRAALTLRAYADDQPLRGRMPQPLGQRRELARVLERLAALRCEPAAFSVLPDTSVPVPISLSVSNHDTDTDTDGDNRPPAISVSAYHVQEEERAVAGADASANAGVRKHLLRLYPLLVRATGVAGRVGDAEVLGLLQCALEVVGGEAEMGLGLRL